MSMKKLILENYAVREYGCLMCYPSEATQLHFKKFGKSLIPNDVIYTDPDDPSFGYEEDFHVTSKYGFKPDLSRQDISNILKDIKPFSIKLVGISLFKNADFNVVKFDVELNETLVKIRSRCDSYPNEDKYPTYHPHATIAYIKCNSFNVNKDDLNIVVPITRIKYSGIDGQKLFINL